MWATSDAFTTAAAATTRNVSYSAVVFDPDTGNETALLPLSMQVSWSAGRQVHGTCSVTLADPTRTLTPTGAQSLLASYGNEIHLTWSLTLADGTVEDVPLGRFRIDSPRVTVGPSGVTIQVDGVDRSVNVARNRWDRTYVAQAGQDYGDIVADIVTDRYPTADVSRVGTLGGSSPRFVFERSEGDPWSDAREVARAAGQMLRFDRLGRLVTLEPATFGDDPAVVLDEGDAWNVLTLSRTPQSGETIYNGVIGTAENTDLDEPLFAEAWDDDPESVTYRFGKFGEVPRLWSTPLIDTQTQLQAAVESLLQTELGSGEVVQWEQRPDLTVEPNDVVEMTSTSAGLDRVTIVVDDVDWSAGSAMRVTGRRRFV